MFGTGTLATWQLIGSAEGFHLLPRDILVVDLSRLPDPGDLALVQVFDDDTATAVTVLRRYLPPWLCPHDLQQPMMRVDDARVTVKHPVVGTIRKWMDKS